MSKFKVVTTDNIFPDLIMEREMLSEIDAELIEVKNPQTINDECKDADAVIGTYAQLGADIINNMQKCKLVIRNGIGVNTIDVDACSKKEIMVANIPTYCLDEVATHAITLLLALARKVLLLNKTVKEGIWDVKKAIPVYSLQKKKLGLVGFGKIPRLVKEKSVPFGMSVIAYDPYVTEEAMKGAGVEKVDMDCLIEESDFISIHCPLTPETKNLFDADAFKRMKKSAYIINTSRGPVINELDIIDALEQGEIAGAGLDVLISDDVDINNPLLKMDNIIITPHAAWYSEESIEMRRRQTIESVISVLLGKEPASLINRKQLGR